MRPCIPLALVVVAALAGCGGSLPIGEDPLPGLKEWTFTPGDTSTQAVWSSNITSSTDGVSAVLRKDGQIEVTAVGAITGMAVGTVDPDGNFSATTGSIHASGTVTHQSASLSVWRPTAPMIKIPMTATTTPPDAYSIYKGVWTGTYKMSDGIEHPLSFYINESGFITGTITEGLVVGTIYGRVDQTAKTVTISIPFKDAAHPGWNFSGTINDQTLPNQASGNIVSANILNPESGTWTVTR